MNMPRMLELATQARRSVLAATYEGHDPPSFAERLERALDQLDELEELLREAHFAPVYAAAAEAATPSPEKGAP